MTGRAPYGHSRGSLQGVFASAFPVSCVRPLSPAAPGMPPPAARGDAPASFLLPTGMAARPAAAIFSPLCRRKQRLCTRQALRYAFLPSGPSRRCTRRSHEELFDPAIRGDRAGASARPARPARGDRPPDGCPGPPPGGSPARPCRPARFRPFHRGRIRRARP